MLSLTNITIAERVRWIGTRTLDGPLSSRGSVSRAETGTLITMLGGDEAAFRLVKPLRRERGQTVTRADRSGQGLLLKRRPIAPRPTNPMVLIVRP